VTSTPEHPPLDIVVVENVDVIRRGLMSLPLTHPGVVASVRAFADVDDIDFSAPAPHVVVLDYWLGREDRPSLAHVERLHDWGALVVLYTTEEHPHPLRLAMRAGIDGLSLKNDGIDALVATISSVGRGETVLSSPLARALVSDQALRASLTTTEIETLRALALGKTPQEIATMRSVAPSTIGTHIEHIRAKYAPSGGKVNRARMVHLGMQDGYVDRRDADEDPENT